MVPTSPLARGTDPHTSQAAADSVVADGTVARHERLILEALERLGPSGGTGAEIADEIARDPRAEHLSFVQVMRRMAGLLDRKVHRRPGQNRQWLARGGKAIHWLGSGFGPLFDQRTPG